RIHRPARRVGEPALSPGPGQPGHHAVDGGHEGQDEADGAEGDHWLMITCWGSCLAWVANFEGHLVIRLSRCAMKVPSSTLPLTITSRPSANGSGTSPL